MRLKIQKKRERERDDAESQRFHQRFETLIRNIPDISKGIQKKRKNKKINSSGQCSNLVKSFVARTTYFTIVVGSWQWPGIKLVFLFPFVETIPAVWVKKFIRSIRLFFFRLDNVRILSGLSNRDPIVELKILLYFLLNHFVRCCATITDLIFKRIFYSTRNLDRNIYFFFYEFSSQE